jgi:hypothetical protein
MLDVFLCPIERQEENRVIDERAWARWGSISISGEWENGRNEIDMTGNEGEKGDCSEGHEPHGRGYCARESPHGAMTRHEVLDRSHWRLNFEKLWLLWLFPSQSPVAHGFLRIAGKTEYCQLLDSSRSSHSLLQSFRRRSHSPAVSKCQFPSSSASSTRYGMPDFLRWTIYSRPQDHLRLMYHEIGDFLHLLKMLEHTLKERTLIMIMKMAEWTLLQFDWHLCEIRYEPCQTGRPLRRSETNTCYPCMIIPFGGRSMVEQILSYIPQSTRFRVKPS